MVIIPSEDRIHLTGGQKSVFYSDSFAADHFNDKVRVVHYLIGASGISSFCHLADSDERTTLVLQF